MSATPYQQETSEHIVAVQHWMDRAAINIKSRSDEHDSSKLEEPEASGFAAMTADKRLKDLTYGSEEYRAVLREHKPIIAHHYAQNDHHPEHFSGGVSEMSLLQLLEMLCDWKAATLRMKDGDLRRSIEHNQGRFGYSDELKAILLATAAELGMLE